jgi:hypothetical protein
MFVTWLEGFLVIATHVVAAREKKENILWFKLVKEGILELGYNFCHVRIN